MARWLAVGLVGLLVCSASVAHARTWTNRAGQRTQGEFVRIHNLNVVLKSSGKVIQVPFSALSDGDQEFVREHLTKQGKTEELARLPGGEAVPELPGLGGGASQPPTFGKPPEFGRPPEFGNPPVAIPQLPPLPAAPPAAGAFPPAGAANSGGLEIPALPSLPGAAQPAAAQPSHMPNPTMGMGMGGMPNGGMPAGNMPGMRGGMPGVGMPGTPVYERVLVCQGCKTNNPENAKKCSGCGKYFDYIVDEQGKRTYTGNGMIGGGVTVVLVIIGLGVRMLIASNRN